MVALTLQGSKDPLYDVIPRYTGQNGYEEYVQAAIALKDPGLLALDSYISNLERRGGPLPDVPAPPNVDPRSGLLTLYKMEANLAERALNLVVAGNEKPVTYPNLPVTAGTLFPEFAKFKTLSRILTRRATVEVAQGDQVESARDFVTGIAFTKRFPPIGLIPAFVSWSCEQILFAAIQKQLFRFGIPQLRMLRQAADSALAQPNAILESTRFERSAVRATFDDFFRRPEYYTEEGESQQSQVAEIKGVSADQREKLYAALVKRFEAPWTALGQRLQGSERTWLAPFDSELSFESEELVGRSAALDSKTLGVGFLYLRVMLMLGYGETEYASILKTAAKVRIEAAFRRGR